MESEDKRMAWFPAPYLEKLDEDGDEDDTDGSPGIGSRLAFLIDNFLPLSAVMLSISFTIRNVVHGSQELQRHQRWRDYCSHWRSGGGSAEVWQWLVARQVRLLNLTLKCQKAKEWLALELHVPQ